MKIALFALLLLLPFLGSKADNPETALPRDTSYYHGKRYDIPVYPSQISAAPKWEDDAPCPLAPQKARTIAQQALSELLGKATQPWHLFDLTLRHYEEGWVYLATFKGPIDGHEIDTFRILIYLDGTVTKPDLSKPMSR